MTPVACFGAGHRKIYHHHLRQFDCEWRRLLRTLLGPPPGVDWSLPWHEILHLWNERVRDFQQRLHLQSWSETCLKHYWRFARHVSCVPSNRWIKRVMEWIPPGSRVRGRPRNSWASHLEAFARTMGWERWMDRAKNDTNWENHFAAFLAFVQQ